MKMLFVVYESGIDEDVQTVLRDAGVPGYTKLTGAVGTGHKGHRFGTQVWPGTNTLLWIVLPDEQIQPLVQRLRDLKASYAKPPALRLFVLPAEVVA
jgi:hypothetical protein